MYKEIPEEDEYYRILITSIHTYNYIFRKKDYYHEHVQTYSHAKEYLIVHILHTHNLALMENTSLQKH